MPPVFWIQRQDIGPSARSGHAMATDSGRDRVVLFGGDPGGAPLADTWEWDGSLWTQVADIGPSPRRGAAMAYSTAAARAFLFGGAYGAGLRGDTWAFDGSDWIQVEDTGPSPRSDHAMAYDQARDRIVMFGGQAAPPAGDTWEWDGNAWVQVEDSGPPARFGHVMAYDATLQRVVLFGGADTAGPGLGDTWTWDGAAWTQVADTGPAPRAFAAVSGGGSVLLFGGVSTFDPQAPAADRVIYGETWRWSNGAWVQVQDIGPAARWSHAMALRPGAGRTVLFGGAASLATTPVDLRGDTWEVPDQAGVPTPDPGTQPTGPNVVMVQVQPQIMFPPGLQPLHVTVQLDGPAAAGSALTIAIHSVFNNNPVAPVSPAGYTIPVVGFSGGETGTVFTLYPDGSNLPQGDYAVMVAVGAGAMFGAAFRFSF